MVFEAKAQLLLNNINTRAGVESQAVSVDPVLAALAIELFKEIVSLYKSCHRPVAMVSTNMKSPGVVARRRLRKLIEARQLPAGISVKQMNTAVLEVGKTVTDDEVAKMYAAV